MTYNLYAERDCCEPRLMRESASLDELADYVERADMAGTWPVGFEAVARPSSGEAPCLLFTDGWEPLSA